MYSYKKDLFETRNLNQVCKQQAFYKRNPKSIEKDVPKLNTHPNILKKRKKTYSCLHGKFFMLLLIGPIKLIVYFSLNVIFFLLEKRKKQTQK